LFFQYTPQRGGAYWRGGGLIGGGEAYWRFYGNIRLYVCMVHKVPIHPYSCEKIKTTSDNPLIMMSIRSVQYFSFQGFHVEKWAHVSPGPLRV
ncbi:MAG: hypothetical protein GY820_17400, partial [Gammaproteobacteria bacterium]|nr:hypothetical protein [Gammaproteobacteria bacterium]